MGQDMEERRKYFLKRFSDPTFRMCERRFFDEGFWKDVWEHAELEKVDEVSDTLIKVLNEEKKRLGGLRFATGLASLKIAILCIIYDVIQKEKMLEKGEKTEDPTPL
jgi:hypothetical protein